MRQAMAIAAVLAWTTILTLGEFAAAAVPPTDALFPNTTRGYVSSNDVSVMREKWDQTQLGQFFDDPLMRPFLDAVEKQFREDRTKSGKDLGITLDELNDVASGEAAVGLVYTPGKPPADMMLADVTNNVPKTRALLTKVYEGLTKQQGTWTQPMQVDGTKWTVFKMPKDPKSPNQPVDRVYFIKDNMLCACESVEVAKGVFERFGGKAKDGLNTVKGYRAVVDRCDQDVKQTGDAAPQIRWYVQPLEYAKARRTTNPKFLMNEKMDMLVAYENAGFTALEAVGGSVGLQLGQFDVYHRVAAYAPSPTYVKSMNMLDFPNGKPFTPAAWLPADLASYTAFNWNMKKAIDNFGPLFNETIGEGDETAWKNALDSITEDPKGPQVDLQGMLFDQMGTLATTVSDCVHPINIHSERRLFIAEIKDAKKVIEALEKNYATDKNAKKVTHGGVSYWEVTPEDAPHESSAIKIEVSGPGIGPPSSPAAAAAAAAPTEPSAVGVVRGELLISSHASFMKKAIDAGKDGKTLDKDADYLRVAGLINGEIKRRSWAGTSFHRFTRSQAAYEPTFELARLNLLPQAETLLGRALNSVLNNTADGKPRKQQVDGAKLPEYAPVKHYFQDSGSLIVSEDGQFKGWFLVGFTLAKDGAAVANKPK